MDYQETLTKAYEQFYTKKNIPELFCLFVNAIPTVSPTSQVQHEVVPLLRGIHTRIQEYTKQYKVLVKELGVICSENQEDSETAKKFFHSYLDLLRLVYSVYEEDDEKLNRFYPLLEQVNTLFETRKLKQIHDPVQEALLVQLTTSAWAYTKAQGDMVSYAKQIDGQRKNKTRKQKR